MRLRSIASKWPSANREHAPFWAWIYAMLLYEIDIDFDKMADDLQAFQVYREQQPCRLTW